MGRLKRTIYARMEEMSFRSGAAAGAGTLVVAGIGITLAVTLTGHGAAATAASGSAGSARPGSASSAVAPSVSGSVVPSVAPAAQSSPSPSPQYQQPYQGYQPASRAVPAKASPALPEDRLGPPKRPHPTLHPTATYTGNPLFPFGG